MNTAVMLYLAGPIDDVDEATGKQWREAVGDHLPVGCAAFSPAHAYFNVSEYVASAVDVCNRYAILASDGILANLGGRGRGLGTVREIEFARSKGKPVAVVGVPRGILMFHDLIKAESLQEAVDELLEAVSEGRSVPHPLAMLLGMEPPEDES